MPDQEGKQPLWRPTQEFPMPDFPPSPFSSRPPVARWVGKLGQAIALILLLLICALLAAPLVWAVRQAWTWALG